MNAQTLVTNKTAAAGDASMLRAAAALARLDDWINSQVRPVAVSSHPEQWSRWEAETRSIREQLRNPRKIQIALIGTTGAGKSTLLNAILGQQVLQVGVMTSITSFVTLVAYQADHYEVSIDFESEDEWRDDVQRYLNAVQPGDDGGDTESKSVINGMRKRIEAVYALESADREWSADELRAMSVHKSVEPIFAGQTHTVRSFSDAKEMLAYLRGVVRADSPVWPLVKQVRISGPYDVLRGGVELVDLPGTNDVNQARVDVTKAFIRAAPFVWLVCAMKRGVTYDIAEFLRRERIFRALVLSGSYNALTIIGTHADDIDIASASQFGLDEETCLDSELVNAYRREFAKTVRQPLLDLVYQLDAGDEGAAVVSAMAELASKATVHAVSASAYNALAKIVPRSSKTGGLTELEDTGIPGVVRHLHAISDELGAGLVGRTALRRIENLQAEIASFFRARAASGNPEVARAKAVLEQQVVRLTDRARRELSEANIKLAGKRTAFLDRLSPLFTQSIAGVKSVTNGWDRTNWATLRAIVNRDGVFKSPSTGLAYDFNEDITDPLLNTFPVVWQAYFTHDLKEVRDHYAIRLDSIAEDFVDTAQSLIQQFAGGSLQLLERQLKAFRLRVDFEKQQCASTLDYQISERRRQAAAGLPQVAKNSMVPAYEAASEEHGPGMKARMLGHLQPAARAAAPGIYDTIQRDLTEALSALESVISRLLDDLCDVCVEQARLIAQNVTMDLDEAQIPPELRELLRTMPANA